MESNRSISPIKSDNLEIINVPGIQKVAEFIEFVYWFATPRRNRKISTQKEFAALINIDEDTLTDWKRRPEFWSLLKTALKKWCQEQVPEVMDGLHYAACKKGNSAAAKVILQFAGLLPENGKKDNTNK